MDKILVDALISEIKNQCEIVEIATNGINAYLNDHSYNNSFLWFNVQAVLVGTANISKILWSYERTDIPEVQFIKELLEINDSSKIKSRFFRNLFEHYDRLLIEWAENRKSDSIATSNVYPKGMRLPVPIENTFKTYYNDQNILAFQGKEYKLQPVIKEVARIYTKILEVEYHFEI